jgi:ABC-type transport system substrate-binding protein
MDPHLYSSTIASQTFLHILDGLVRLTVDLEVVPQLATSWEVAEDKVTWTFYLRRGVKFHDGTPFNAQAVKFNFETVTFAHPPVRRTGMFAAFIKSLKVVDNYTIQIITREPFGPMLEYLAHPASAIMSKAHRKEVGVGADRHPVGTGPFRFVEWKAGDRLVMERNEEYWGELPRIERIILKPVPESAARVMMLETGEAHVICDPEPHDIPILEAIPGVEVFTVAETRASFALMNNQRWPFSDVRVRHALNHAVDVEAIITYLFGGFGVPLTSPLPPKMWGHVDVGDFEYNPERARELLREAGVPEGFKVRLWTYVHYRYPVLAEGVAAFLEAVGLNVEITIFEWAAFLAHRSAPLETTKVEIMIHGWGAGTVEPDWQLRPLLTRAMWPPRGWNAAHYHNPEVDKWIHIGMTEVDREKRLAAYAEAQQLIFEDAPWIFLMAPYAKAATRGVEGVWVFPHGGVMVREASFVE